MDGMGWDVCPILMK